MSVLHCGRWSSQGGWGEGAGMGGGEKVCLGGCHQERDDVAT